MSSQVADGRLKVGVTDSFHFFHKLFCKRRQLRADSPSLLSPSLLLLLPAFLNPWPSKSGSSLSVTPRMSELA